MPMILKAAGPRMFCFQRRENRLISWRMIFIVWPQRPHSAVQPSECAEPVSRRAARDRTTNEGIEPRQAIAAWHGEPQRLSAIELDLLPKQEVHRSITDCRTNVRG